MESKVSDQLPSLLGNQRLIHDLISIIQEYYHLEPPLVSKFLCMHAMAYPFAHIRYEENPFHRVVGEEDITEDQVLPDFVFRIAKCFWFQGLDDYYSHLLLGQLCNGIYFYFMADPQITGFSEIRIYGSKWLDHLVEFTMSEAHRTSFLQHRYRVETPLQHPFQLLTRMERYIWSAHGWTLDLLKTIVRRTWDHDYHYKLPEEDYVQDIHRLNSLFVYLERIYSPYAWIVVERSKERD